MICSSLPVYLGKVLFSMDLLLEVNPVILMYGSQISFQFSSECLKADALFPENLQCHLKQNL